jgi:hypothetical protein
MGTLSLSIGRAVERTRLETFLLSKQLAQLAHARLHPDETRQVVFVGGVQRSGTNMLMDALERSRETAVFHEKDPRAFNDYMMLPPPAIHRLVDASPARCVVLKALCELQDLTRLLAEFAPAKALWSVRRYEDMVNSHVRSWPGEAKTMDKLVANRNSMRWRGRGMSDETYATISRLHHPGLDDWSAAALFWYLRNVLFFEQGFDSDPRVRLVKYESLVRTPDQEFRQIFDFLGLDYSRRIASSIHARSIRKNAAPPIEPGIREICGALTARFDEVLLRQEGATESRQAPQAAPLQLRQAP